MDEKIGTDYRCFISAGKENDSEGKVTKIAKGMDLIKSYIQNNPDISDELRTYTTNLRRTYIYSLLKQLSLIIAKAEMCDWIMYIIILAEEKETVDYVFEQYPELKENYHKAEKIWFGYFSKDKVDKIREIFR
ncbi:MAG: hypothetical protein J7L08_01025 [Candidatus Aenigmarchaeota archaeon]|nr:hypothetical protein [Candidatus Aenigmarchaeota archaeon]